MIKEIKKILVPLDGSKNSFRGLDEAISLAKKNNASITGLFVIQAYPTEIGVLQTAIGKALSKQSKNFLSQAQKVCKQNNIDFIDIIDYGDEGAKIVSYAKKNKCDMIIIGSRGIGGIKQLILGSTTNYVLHNSKIPVLVVK